ncbi:MAG: ornithine cyclodeaminase family protein [Ilumatobacter sp.]
MEAIRRGHELPAAQVGDTLLQRGDDALLSRAAMIDGLGSLVKTATVFPGNVMIPGGASTINGSASLFSDTTGQLDATIDFHLLTKWKTAADSALAARQLARADSEQIVIVGSGTVARSMTQAYRCVFPDASIGVWSRTHGHAQRLADDTGCHVIDDLERGVESADIICTATMSSQPVVSGSWLRAGQHLDLIGGYRPDMREVDDEAIARADVFADCIDTAVEVGDFAHPMSSGLLDRSQTMDFSGIADSTFVRSSADSITICKNAGGAHLDLMVARYMFDAQQS